MVKVALDENRMLVLVVEVLLGFGFQGVFQPGFARLMPAAQWTSYAAICLLIVMVGMLLMIPARHRVVERGRDTAAFRRFATGVMRVTMLPFSLVVALQVFSVTARLIGTEAAVLLAMGVFLVAAGLWYGVPALFACTRRRPREENDMKSEMPPLKDRINQVLTECRVIIPGTQALLGFQFVAFLYDAFEKLDPALQRLHLAALLAILLSAIFLMLPAAFHRIAEGGHDTESMLRVSNTSLLIALALLALGLAMELLVVTARVFGSATLAAWASAAAFLLLASLWYVFPLWLRRNH